MENKEQFLAKFNFKESGQGLVGVEREQFLIDPISKEIVPKAFEYLSYIDSKYPVAVRDVRFNFGYELSACQLESKIGPCLIKDIHGSLVECEKFLSVVDKKMALERINLEVAPEDLPLDIFPDPTGRYGIIVKNMPYDILSAACRVAATHIHIGMPNIGYAIDCYNRSIEQLDDLIIDGDNSSGGRIALYKKMANKHRPEKISSENEFYNLAIRDGFVSDPRKCWTLIRISVHGTLEFRMFGATDEVKKIMEWVHRCHKICFGST